MALDSSNKPDLCEMGVNDISLKLLQSGVKQAVGEDAAYDNDLIDEMVGQEVFDVDDGDLLQPESSRTTVIEISD